MTYTMDANALIAYLNGEPGGEVVDEILTDPDNTCVAHAINICEVYYDFFRRADEATAREAVAGVVEAGVTIREDMDPDLWREAGRCKAEMKRVSLADCFCMALANRVRGELVTADHHEFDEVASNGLCKVKFIR